MRDLRILMLSRATLFSHPGGDTIQIRKTAEYLNKLQGIEVSVKTVNENIDYSQFDLLHLFNVSRPADLLGVIKRSGLPYVISTIFVDFSEAEKNHYKKWRGWLNKLLNTDQVEYIKAVARMLQGQDKLTDKSYLFRGQRASIKKLIKNASLLLPNSQSEYDRLLKAYGCEQKYRVIPNAIDTKVFDRNAEIDHSFDTFNGAVVSVGQITPVKNQLNLIKALNNSSFKLFIIGSPSSNATRYFKKCKQAAAENITFVPYLDQKDLAKVYRKAKVHVLSSWFETTGLVSLEAAYMGCNIVITNRGDQSEYFGEHAFYCDPEDPKSIYEAVELAYEAEFREQFVNVIENNYTWSITAQRTREAYQAVISKIES
ncbi:MAG: glycosyltransferase family 4 protein [Bacteroidia bacterium]|nr:glycosyltransferase family 4 protein [Bacteroidia bacterium]NNM23548.1 glycosyltransferase family 4 protein [Flavobacteriaceae bacterium]